MGNQMTNQVEIHDTYAVAFGIYAEVPSQPVTGSG